MSRWIIRGRTNSSLTLNMVKKRNVSEGVYITGKERTREFSDREKDSIANLDVAIKMNLVELIEIKDIKESIPEKSKIKDIKIINIENKKLDGIDESDDHKKSGSRNFKISQQTSE